MKSIQIILVALVCSMFTAKADAAKLYAATAAGAPGELYILNPANGAVVQDVGPTNDATGTNYPITGLAFHPTTGVLYGSTGNNPEVTGNRLVTINPLTGLTTVIGLFNAGPVNSSGVPTTMTDLAFDAAGNLYGVGSIGGPQIYSINTLTGQANVIGSSGISSTSGGGLAISSNGVFYGSPTATRFGTYDTGTGAFTNIANPTEFVGGAWGALDYNQGVLYGLNVGSGTLPPTHLAIFNPATGGTTDLGASVDTLDAIAFQIPEPATLALLAIGLTGLVGWRRR